MFAATRRRPVLLRITRLVALLYQYGSNHFPPGKGRQKQPVIQPLLYFAGVSRMLTTVYVHHPDMNKIYRVTAGGYITPLIKGTVQEKHMPTELIGSKDAPPAKLPSALDIKVQEQRC